jgi:hypothetical protein
MSAPSKLVRYSWPMSGLARRVDLGIDREGRYRGVTGPPCEIGKRAAYDA